MTTITANVSKMFDEIEPWLVSNSIANLGENAGKLTWENALKIAQDAEQWLMSDAAEAVEGMREWAGETGAWDREEIAAWPDVDCLALFVQNVASDLRDHLDSDNRELAACARLCQRTDWDKQSCSPTGYYYVRKREVRVDYYTGC